MKAILKVLLAFVFCLPLLAQRVTIPGGGGGSSGGPLGTNGSNLVLSGYLSLSGTTNRLTMEAGGVLDVNGVPASAANWHPEGTTNSDLYGTAKVFSMVVTNSLDVGASGEAGSIDLYSTNGTYIVTLTVNADGTFNVSTNTIFQGWVSFGGLTNVLERSGNDLLYTNGGSQVYITAVNGSGATASVGLTSGGSAVLTGSGASTFLGADGITYLAINSASLQPNTPGNSPFSLGVDSAGGAFSNLWLKGTAEIIGAGAGTTNYSRLAISHSGTSGSVIFDSQSAGSAGAARPFSFRTNGVEISFGTTINSTDGYLPYRSSATAFSDSPWYRKGATDMGFGSTVRFVYGANNNTTLGASAGAALISGADNTFFGRSAGSAYTGDENFFIGSLAGYQATGGANEGVGTYSLLGLTSGTFNLGVGKYSLQDVTTGKYNIGIGYAAGAVLTTGSTNIFVGNHISAAAATTTNAIGIGHDITVGSNQIVIGGSSQTSVVIGGVDLRDPKVNSLLSTGIVSSVKAFQAYQGTLTHAGTVTLDFDGATTVNSLSLTGDVTFAFSNVATNRTARLRIVGCSTNSSITWPSGVHGQPPTIAESNRWVFVSLEGWGTGNTNVAIAQLPDL